MKTFFGRHSRALCALAMFVFALAVTAPAFAGTIVIQNNNAPGVGFNDPSPRAPIAGNNGTTLGQQRLNVFQHAADIWGATLPSDQTIIVRAQFAAQTCTSAGAVLGSAGSTTIHSDFPGSILPGHWYNQALGNKLSHSDLDPSNPDINATFNLSIDSGCFSGILWYYGFDGNEGDNIELLSVVLHEIGHGLGFQTFTSGQTGDYNGGQPSVWDHYLLDKLSGLHWDENGGNDRINSAVSVDQLVWDGPQAMAKGATYLGGRAGLRVTSPGGIAGFYGCMTPGINGAPLTVGGVTGDIVQALDGTPPAEDVCEPIINAAALVGKIAIVNRGTCTFVSKAQAVQDAGAIGCIIVNNTNDPLYPPMGGDFAGITIPAIGISQADGGLIQAQLGGGVTATIGLDPILKAGADESGRLLMYAPATFSPGSSVSHWDDTDLPNTLMEYAINDDLHDGLDITPYLLADMGWFPAATLAVGVSPEPSKCGDGVTLTCTITPTGDGKGTVQFYDGATLLGSADIVGNTTATFVTGPLTSGSHSFTAQYQCFVCTSPVVSPAVPHTVTGRTILASAGSGGSISPSGSVAADCGTSPTFTITPDFCRVISDVVVDGNSVGAVASYTFSNIQADHTITASFAPTPPSTIFASAGPGGSISPSGSVAVACDGSQTFAITPAACQAITNVIVDGNSVGAVPSYTFNNVTSNHTISATFATASYTILSSAGPNGSISPLGTVTLTCGDSQSYSIAADAGYDILDVLVDGNSVGPVAAYSFNNVTANHTIAASFAIGVTPVIQAQSTSSYICPANPCQMLPVTLVRGNTTALLGFSVTIQLSGNLALCSPSSITEGTFLSSAGATSFHVIDNGGGSYTVDGAVLGNDCGPTLTSGTLFNVGVTSVAAGGTGSVTVTSVLLRDCNNGPLPALAGAAGTVPIDNQAPVVTVTSPNGGETWIIGTSQNITWTATDNTGVANVDIDYSLDGGATYPVNVATAVANSGSFAWTVPGPSTTQGRIRVTAHDVACSSASDASDANFTVRDPIITASAGPNGSISPSGAITVPSGGSQSFTIAAIACYHIADVLVDGSSVGAVSSYTFSNVLADHTIAASFAINVYTITASASAGGTINPNGSVSVNCGDNQSFSITPDACNAIQDVKVDGNSVGAVASYTFSSVGANHTIAATFISTSVVTTTTLTSAPSPSVCLQAVTLTATVAPASAVGSVEFFDGATSLGTQPLSGGTASLNLPAGLSVGSHSLKAVYTPTGCFVASQGLKTHVVNKATVTITLTSDFNPSVYGQTVTFTATVSPSTATGTVAFSDSGVVFATVPLSGGTAQVMKSDLATGRHTQIAAAYSGDACYLAKTSANLSQLVNHAPTTSAATTDINPSICGQNVHITATVSPIGVTGKVQFIIDGLVRNTAFLDFSTGMAGYDISSMLPGKHIIKVRYLGDIRYAGSTSPDYSQTVDPAPTSVALTSDVNPAKYGEVVNLTATVTPSDATGSVEFFDGATSLGSVPVSGGVATLQITTQLAAGSHSLTATYGGDFCYGVSTSAAITQVITADAPPQVTVIFPNGGETLCIGGDVKLVWTATDNTAVTSIQLEMSRDYGATWETITASTANTGSYVWRVTGPGTNVGPAEVYSCQLRVTATDNAGITGSDQSDAGVSIADCPVLTVITQLDAESIDLGVRVKWAFATGNPFAKVALQRASAEVGPWADVAAEFGSDGNATVAVDRSAEAGQSYFYRLVATTAAGNQAVYGPVKGTAGAPKEFALSALFPNPTHGPVTMTFAVPKTAHVRLSVIDLQGREMSLLASGEFKAGRYQVNWDGHNSRGKVPAGLYFVHFSTPGKDVVSRIVVTN